MRSVLVCAVLAFGLGGCAHRLSEADLSDPGIKARLESQLRGKKLDLRYVVIDVHSRIVTLSGMVSSYRDKETLSRVAHGVPGVEQVVVNLIVQE